MGILKFLFGYSPDNLLLDILLTIGLVLIIIVLTVIIIAILHKGKSSGSSTVEDYGFDDSYNTFHYIDD